MRDKPKTTPRTQRFLSKRRSTIIAWLSWEDSDDSDSQTHQPSTGYQFPVGRICHECACSYVNETRYCPVYGIE